jgi:NADPH-dependent curcumin reductase CurA
MAPIINKRIILKEFPTGKHDTDNRHGNVYLNVSILSHPPLALPVPGQTTTLDASQAIDLDNVPLNGGVLVKTLVLSLEPYVLARMKAFMPVSLFLESIMFKNNSAYISAHEQNRFQIGQA